eukprot:535063_1
MARVKQTSRKPCTGGKSPRKQLATIANQKRKTPDNDGSIGNETKRRKLNSNTLSSDDESNTADSKPIRRVLVDESTSSSSSSDSSDSSGSEDMDLAVPMQSVLDNARAIFKSTDYGKSQMKSFVQQLCAVSTAQDVKLKELEFRQTALTDFLKNTHWRGPTKFCKIAETTLMGARFLTEESR